MEEVVVSSCLTMKGNTHAKRLRLWTYPLENNDGNETESSDEDIGIENEELKLDSDRAQSTEYPTRDFVTRQEAQDIVATGM